MSMEVESRGIHGNANSANVEAGIAEGILRSICLTPAAAVATLNVTDGGNVNVTLQAAAGGSSVERRFLQGLGYSGPLTVTITGVGAVYDMEVA